VTDGAVAEIDGRRLRREQNREAVLDALIAFFEEGNLQPSASEIAVRAGLSPRSLFRYFDDVDDLHRSAIERHHAQARPLLDLGVDADAPTAEKVARVVEARCRLWETMGAGARAARVWAPRCDVVAGTLARNRERFRSQVRAVFAPELDGTGLLPAVDTLLSFETYDLLRTDQRLSRPKAAAALTAALTALLAHEGDHA
jgi:AcrR family transcriptional regulator